MSATAAALHPAFELALRPFRPRDHRAEALAALQRDAGDFSDNIMAPAFDDDENEVHLLQHRIFTAEQDTELLGAARALRGAYRARAEAHAQRYAESV